jgi:RNA polymerase sigma-70 factor (ECF subfamily)
VFIKIFTKLDQFSGKVPLEHWVARVAINACISQIEKERVRPEVRWSDLSEKEESVLQHLASTSSDLAPDHQLGSAQLVEKLLQSLPAADRLLVTWLHMEGRPMKEICAKTGWSLPLVKVRAFRARQRLKKELKKLLREKI